MGKQNPRQTNLGGGHLGYLELMLTPAMYDTLSATYFVSPVNPGASPVFHFKSTIIEQTSICYKFDKKTALFTLTNNVEKALKLQILASMDRVYTHALKEKYAT